MRKSKLEEIPNVSGYTSSVSAGCILKPIGLACRFCRTGTMIPYAGSLTAHDIAKQNVFMVLTDMYCADHPELSKNAREFAYMGQGEPGYSYVQVREAIKITDKIMNELGQDVYRHIVATSGVPEMVSAYKDDMRNHIFENRVTMHYPLYATKNREFIMPIDTLYSYKQILAQLDEIIDITGEKPCVGIMLFRDFVPKGKTDAYSNDICLMRTIADELNPQRVRISLCEFNASVDTGTSEGWDYEENHLIKKVFEDKGFEVKLFSSFGREKNAACGTLGGAAPEYCSGNKWENLERSAEELVFYKLNKKKYEKIAVGIGIDDGVALMVKAGYAGSGLNDVIWMGNVVNSACHLANKAGRGFRKTILVSSKVYENVLENTQKLLSSCIIDGATYYEGDFIWQPMEDWYKVNCK